MSLLRLAAEHVRREECRRPDIGPSEEELLNSLCQFDLLAAVAVIAEARSVQGYLFYTSFARYNWERSEPALLLLLDEGSDARKEIFSLDNEDRATAIRAVSNQAHNAAFRYAVFSGWESPRIEQFLYEHPTPEPDEEG